jgi:hypothetical protein
MVELQGSLDIQHATSLQNLSIGSLCHTSAVTTHTLTPLTSHDSRCFVFFGGGGVGLVIFHGSLALTPVRFLRLLAGGGDGISDQIKFSDMVHRTSTNL